MIKGFPPFFDEKINFHYAKNERILGNTREHKGIQEKPAQKIPQLKEGEQTKKNVTNGIITKGHRNLSPKKNMKSNQRPNLTIIPFPTMKHSIVPLPQNVPQNSAHPNDP